MPELPDAYAPGAWATALGDVIDRVSPSAVVAPGTNRGNAVVWGVGDEIDAIVAALKAKGAAFEHYPDIGRFADGVHHVGGRTVVRAW